MTATANPVSNNTAPNEKDRTWLYISVRVKLMVAISLLLLVVFVGAFIWFSNFATQIALNRVYQDMIITLNAAVEGIDVDEFVAISVEGGDEDPRYQEHLDWIRTVQLIEPRGYIYTYIAAPDPAEILWIADGLQFLRPGEEARFFDVFRPVGPLLGGLTQETLNLRGYTDQWGAWISAYRPIFDDNGDVVGAAGIDFEYAYVNEVRSGVLNSLLVVFGISLILLPIVVFFIAQALTRSIKTLTHAAARIGEGDYSPDFTQLTKARFPDEITKLASVFDIMVGKVEQREEKLKERVAALEIMVDQTKRDKQVSEIIDSDFFQDLQVKAKEMRGRKHRSAETNDLTEPGS
jgi:methyl-accepting chemotaxis protein